MMERIVANAVFAMWRDDHGVTVVEYGLIGALVAVVMCYAYINLGNELATLFTSVANSL